MNKIPLLVFGLAGAFFMFCCCATGAACSLGFSPAIDKRASDIAKRPTTPDVAAGTNVALTGTLSGNPTVSSDPDVPEIAQYNVVAYKVESYEKSTSGSGSSRRTTGSWRLVRTVVNSLKMTVGGQSVSFYAGSSMTLGGQLHTLPENSAPAYGSKRVSGFQNGDQITVVAKRMGDGRFLADELYGGTRDELVSGKRAVAGVLRYGGYALMGVGGFIGLIMLVVAFIALKK